ncbi:tricorn protease [Nonlabens sp. Hel1_33_55]|uniref:S41 family peptidase n=1 Tax=Nonlabens sp. Hel1_33_55 TaxID=1336802 RepID=UPI000875AD77|nr:S41 family peptidase [Nonlabens sp. Hel1_33_55]SCX88609.1 tricorn protease [Nonlabens sp. Hel1_33_55]
MKSTILILFGLLSSLGFSQGTKLLRQPTIHSNQIVFVYGNDLWTATTNGGMAQRLTSDIGYESVPHFSPDGTMIAFTGEYDGNIDVFVIPSNGGTPQRLTYHPGGDFVTGWTPDNKVLFRSDREGKPTETTKFFTIGLEDAFPESMKLTRAAYGEISPDGNHIAYTPITSWDPEWRNYRGGQAMPIWVVNLETMELQTTSQPTKERHLDPVWHDGKVYFLSERDYTSNIWSYDPNTKQENQITFHKKFDVKSLDADENQIVYEHGGQINLLNPSTGATRVIPITVSADLNTSRERWEDATARDLTNASLSPNGMRALFEYRGEIFSVPKEKGSWRNLSNAPGSAQRSPVWSPLGDKVAWFSDASGEYALVIADQYGSIIKTISFDDPTFYFQPQWSPDGKNIAYTDTHYNIWITNIDSGTSTKADTDSYAHPDRSMNPVWSPDSQWIAYAKQQQSHFKAIYAYNIASKKIIQITDPLADAITPIWDESGEYLYTLASTNYGLTSGWLDMSSYDPSTTRSLYAVVLSKNGKAPNLPESDEETTADIVEDKKEQKKEREKKGFDAADDEAKKVNVVINEEGIYDRIVTMNLPERNYIALAKAEKGNVFVLQQIENEDGFKLHLYDTKKQEATDFADGIQDLETSFDGTHILLNHGNSYSINPTKSPIKSGDGKIDTNLSVKVDPQAEYVQIFKEGWRYMRDFLYVDNVHGAPWDKIYEWYSPWIKNVRHRTDLNYVVDIMSGEVAIGHSYVSGGDLPDPGRIPVGLLGVDLEVENDRYKISKIYNGERWNPDTTSPLGMAGIDVNVGDYLISINGKELKTDQNPYKLLEQTANREIMIEVSSKANGSSKRQALVKPISSERSLRYIDWVEGNRRKVDELSDGKLAYVYIPNTSPGGFTSFNRYLFSQQDKKGVVLDERNNGGGSAADYMIDILKREPFGYFNSKANDNRPWTTPMAGIFGPKVMIINERAGSGGDLLPYMFKQQNLGPLVGTRTWGGLVGTWDTPPFVDGGRMVAPRGGFYDLNGEWAVEGEGVAPDIEVIQNPKSTTDGRDPQLERAVEEALKLLPAQEFKMKPEPAAPVRWKRPDGYDEEN